LDVGSPPEYATAECSSLADLLAQDRAGDAIIAALADAARSRTGVRIALFKNNLDSAGHSFGSHENYQIAREGAAALAARLIPFLVTRQLIAGAGHVLVGRAGARYVLSQRADHISEALSSATTRSRPMINTRDEPHADGQKYRRLHIIVGDSNMSQAATFWKVGATALVISAAAAGALTGLELADPVRAIREVSHGWREARVIALADGKTIRPAEIQRICLDAARAFGPDGGGALGVGPLPPAESARVLSLWERALDAWDAGDFGGLETELDWLAKLRLIDRYRQRSGAVLADPRVARLELAYHQLGPGGLRGRMEASGALARVIAPGEAARAVLEGPSTTRAGLRGRFVAAARAAGAEYTADWARLKLGDRTASLLEPAAAAYPEAERLIGALGAGRAASDHGPGPGATLEPAAVAYPEAERPAGVPGRGQKASGKGPGPAAEAELAAAARPQAEQLIGTPGAGQTASGKGSAPTAELDRVFERAVAAAGEE
jgi:proteasome accessory factor A